MFIEWRAVRIQQLEKEFTLVANTVSEEPSASPAYTDSYDHDHPGDAPSSRLGVLLAIAVPLLFACTAGFIVWALR